MNPDVSATIKVDLFQHTGALVNFTSRFNTRVYWSYQQTASEVTFDPRQRVEREVTLTF